MVTNPEPKPVRASRRKVIYPTSVFSRDSRILDKVELTIDENTGRPVRLVITAAGGLKPSDLRRVPWRTWFALASALVRDPDVSRFYRGQEEIEVPDIEDELDLVRPKHPGRRGHSDEHYATIANRYRGLTAAGRRDPTATIARENHVARPTAAGWIKQADERRRPWRRERWPLDGVEPEAVPGGSPEDRDALLRALAELPPRQRRTVVLRYFCGLSVEETASDLSCSTGTVKSQTSAALHKLEALLSPTFNDDTQRTGD